MEKCNEESNREFCKARNKVKKLTRKAETAKTDSQYFWKYVNSKRKTKS